MAAPKKKKRMSIEEQKVALKHFVLNTPLEDILPNKNRQAVETLKKAGLLEKGSNDIKTGDSNMALKKSNKLRS